MSLAIKSINDVQSYVPNDIAALEASIDAKFYNSYDKFQLENDLLEIDNVIKGIGSDEFLALYSNILTKMLRSVKGPGFLGDELFDPKHQPDFHLTKLRPDHLAQDFDNAVSSIRALCKLAFPNMPSALKYALSLKTNKGFINNLGHMKPKDMPASFGVLQEHIRGFYERYKTLEGKKHLTEGDLKVLDGLNSNLQNISGQIIWENVALEARKMAIKIYFAKIEPDIVQAFLDSGGKMIVTGEQTGAKTGGKGQEVADSMVKISFQTNNGTVIASVTTSDSTKLSGDIDAITGKSFNIGSTSARAKMQTVDYLTNLVGQNMYWRNRLQAYLDNSLPTAQDEENWDNTRLAFYLLELYDALAVRATTTGQYAQTLSINDKMLMINNIIKNVSSYYQNKSQGQAGIRGPQNNIFNMGSGYQWYVKTQLLVSRGRSWDNQKYSEDEPILEATYNKYIQQVMATKISISTNVFLK